jgi:hypothetical protein
MREAHVRRAYAETDVSADRRVLTRAWADFQVFAPYAELDVRNCAFHAIFL